MSIILFGGAELVEELRLIVEFSECCSGVLVAVLLLGVHEIDSPPTPPPPPSELELSSMKAWLLLHTKFMLVPPPLHSFTLLEPAITATAAVIKCSM